MMSCAPPVVAPPLVVRSDCENLARLASRWSKPSDLDTCPTSSFLHQFCGATDKLKPAWFWGPNKEIVTVILRLKSSNHSCQFWGPNRETVTLGFDAKSRKLSPPGETVPPVLMSNREKPSDWFWGQITHKPSPWFWGSIKKSVLLISMCTVQTAHSVTRPLNHPTTEYPIYAIIPVLCTRSPTRTTILVATCHAAPATCTLWDKQMWFSKWNKDKGKTNEMSRIQIQTSAC
jgi:hypothetical protein